MSGEKISIGIRSDRITLQVADSGHESQRQDDFLRSLTGTAFALITSASPNFVSFIPQTFATDNGDLVFTNISQLSFQAVIPGAETPLPAALPLFAAGLGALGLLARRRKRKAATV